MKVNYNTQVHDTTAAAVLALMKQTGMSRAEITDQALKSYIAKQAKPQK